MFGAFFGSIMGKISAGLLLVAVVALGYYKYENLSQEKDLALKDGTISTLNSTIETDKGTIDNLNKQLKLAQDLKDVGDKTRADTKAATDTLSTKDQTVSQKTHKAVAQIESDYASKPQTPANQVAKDNEVSKTRLSALNAVFCNSYPNDASCSGGGVAASVPAVASAASH
jgi:uncharacterized coiled-coil protein SlyX